MGDFQQAVIMQKKSLFGVQEDQLDSPSKHRIQNVNYTELERDNENDKSNYQTNENQKMLSNEE